MAELTSEEIRERNQKIGNEIQSRVREALGAKSITHQQLADYMGYKGITGRNRITAKLNRPVDSIQLVLAVSALTGYYTSWLMLGRGPQLPQYSSKEEYDKEMADANAPATMIIPPETAKEQRLILLEEYFEKIKEMLIRASDTDPSKPYTKTSFADGTEIEGTDPQNPWASLPDNKNET